VSDRLSTHGRLLPRAPQTFREQLEQFYPRRASGMAGARWGLTARGSSGELGATKGGYRKDQLLLCRSCRCTAGLARRAPLSGEVGSERSSSPPNRGSVTSLSVRNCDFSIRVRQGSILLRRSNYNILIGCAHCIIKDLDQLSSTDFSNKVTLLRTFLPVA
jgi:hypothetical protein